ncbi:hypothetical protein GCM10027034_01740 [Ramlibacter solisilvae]|uniref:Uncharacterized protein n=1 Tax=Ramlibacter tataouinensis TaxID=94132 RepID=A0A127JYX6_9BURK|nr:hypothetical protein [Ramlibacter tataouinensis]AMO25177.1 hypothetical protein UC35_01045 [Ramlibacter tataouinensis]
MASLLIAASAAIIFTLGALHLWYTFRGNKLHPRDPELRVRLEQVPLVLTRQTTMWKAWVGFNASHSHGALLFGAVYGYLALVHSAFLFQSWFLLALGLLALAAYALLGKRYWFSVPFRGILLATAFYVGALVLAMAGA